MKNQLNGVTFNDKAIIGDHATINETAKGGPEGRERRQPAPARKILFFSANPADTVRLRIDEEVRGIQEALRGRDGYQFETRWAVRDQELVNLLIAEQPDFVHFSGHGGSAAGIMLEGFDGCASAVPAAVLGNLFGLLSARTRCVVLSSCYSEEQAAAVGKHIDFVVGTSNTISDRAAIAFSRSFYASLASDLPLPQAFAAGRIQVQIESPGDEGLLCALQRTNPLGGGGINGGAA